MTVADHRLPPELAAEIRAAAGRRAGAMLDRLETYVRLETPTGDADHLDRFTDLLAERHRALGAEVRREPSGTGSHLVVEHPGAGPRTGEAPVLLVGHHDTVWPLGHLDTAMPWRVDDGVAHGPGAYDMKSGLVVIETAVDILAELGLAHRPVLLVVTADEEIGSPSSTDLVTRCADGVVAALGFESPHPDGSLKVGRRGSTRLRLNVRGREAHAALDPTAGISAVDELVDQLVRVRAIIDAAPGEEVLCNVGTVRGGGKTNVVPGEASADIGLRFLDPVSEQFVLDRLGALSPVRDGAEVAAEILSRRPTWVPGTGTPELLGLITELGDALGQQVGGSPAAGAADTNTTGALGIPTLDGLGPRGAGAHALHEQVVISSLPERAALVAAVLASL